MFLRGLKLFAFRNLEDGELSFHPSVNLISGRNGQGKSNLIEAIHILSATKSFRSAQLSEIARFGSEEFSIFGTVAPGLSAGSGGSDIPLGVSYTGGKKRVFIDASPTRDAERYLRIFPTVAFAPRDVDLVYGSPGARRKLLDRTASLLSPGVLTALSAYEKALRSKNALLKSPYPQEKQLMTINHLLATHAETISRARADCLELLRAPFTEYHQEFAATGEEVALTLSETFERHGSRERRADAYREVLMQTLEHEIQRRATLVGPHLDDLTFLFQGRPARHFASQGQARSMVLALFLALVKVIEERLGIVPSLLLDDFSSELDSERMQRFFQLIRQHASQVFITGTELERAVFAESDHIAFTVEKGRIQRS